MSELDAFLRWCHPDLMVERLRHASACWHLCQALALASDQCLAPEAGSPSWHDWSGVPLGISSALQSRATEPPSRAATFLLEPERAAIWVLALVQEPAHGPCDPLDPEYWLFWVIPARQLHPDRRSIALNPLRRAHGDGIPRAGLHQALLNLRPTAALAPGVSHLPR